MAEEEKEEEIVIIEDSDAASEKNVEEEQKEEKSSKNEEDDNKKILIIGAIAVLVTLIIAIVIVIVVLKIKKDNKKDIVSTNIIEQKLENKPKKKIKPSKLENMIAKANYLYTTGQKEQALKIYEYIAQYSESISQYNLGVARLKNKQYKEALQSFNNAIDNGEKRCVSAINAAVCSLYLKDEAGFKYYIDLAEAYLPNEINSPLYSYYYSLIKFYHQNYYEALASIQKVNNPDYIDIKNRLNAKLSALFGSNYSAIESLEDIMFDSENSFSKALLYARIGDLSLAKANFEDSISKAYKEKESTIGLIYTKIKLGYKKEAASQMNDAIKKFGDDILDNYPIRVFIKKSIFNPLKAQEKYRKDIKDSNSLIFQKIFYFSPYKIFNANQTINYIRKGNATSYIDSVSSAESFLKKSASTSKVNKGIALAIKKALNFKIREANKILQKLVKIQPKHSILHYNLALTYAQLGDMQNAYKHFIWSYHLDAKNYLPGIYAYMTSKLINNENTKLLSTLKESLSLEDEDEETQLYKTLLNIAQNQYLTAIDWLDNKYKTSPLYLIITNIVALHVKEKEKAIQAAKELTALMSDEILPHLIYIDTKLVDTKKELYSKDVQKYMRKQSFTFDDLYYGPFITRYMYIQHNLITGQLYTLANILRKELAITTSKDTIDMEQALALTLFYNKEFEESYILYNHMIDEEKIRDARTLFLAATAAIEANHHANAIALLELSKLKNKRFAETRYALALLYFEINNPRGGLIDMGKIPTKIFHSKYFDFDIDLEKLTFKHQHSKQ